MFEFRFIEEKFDRVFFIRIIVIWSQFWKLYAKLFNSITIIYISLKSFKLSLVLVLSILIIGYFCKSKLDCIQFQIRFKIIKKYPVEIYDSIFFQGCLRLFLPLLVCYNKMVKKNSVHMHEEWQSRHTAIRNMNM